MKNRLILLVWLLTPLALAGQTIINPSFESDMTGWNSSSPNALAVGPNSGYPARGTHGDHVGQLGTFDVPNTYLYQDLSLQPAFYSLTFTLGAEASISGLFGRILVMVTNSAGAIFGSSQYSILTLGGSDDLRNGFVANVFNFTIPAGSSSARLVFADISPNGGAGVDPMIDQLVIVPEPGSLSLGALSLLALLATAKGLKARPITCQ